MLEFVPNRAYTRDSLKRFSFLVVVEMILLILNWPVVSSIWKPTMPIWVEESSKFQFYGEAIVRSDSNE